ncbi:MAG TPA: amidase family protein [Vicinamibacterales bacterium]|jgi:Asp-tRNA(Asn)/Glu-tRNA(Gln) amidotransferase A subunit family amidase
MRPSFRVITAAAIAIAAASLAMPHAQEPSRAPFQVEEATIAGVHAAMQDGRLTCHQLVEDYLQRIAAYDKNGPAINALIEVNPDALKEADDLDRRDKQGGFVGPLHCVPMIVKDNYQTIGLQSAAGSLSLKGFVSDKDAFLVKKVKAAGAIVLAKSNMAEFAFSPYETVSSILPGYTRNPYDTSRVTAGSSGGTAAAIAASFGLVGFGTDTGNSIRGPSSHQALVGIRSTMGLTSRAGIVPLNLLADVAGPMARSVADAVAVFQVIVGPDPDDPVTEASRAHLPQSYAASLVADGLKGARIGVLRQAWDADTADPEVMQVFAHALDELKAAGATIVDPATVEGLEAITRGEPAGPCMGFKYDINRYLAAQGTRVPVHTLAEIIKSRKFHPSVELRLERAEAGPVNGPDTPACQAETSYREKVREAVMQTMTRLRLEAFVYPTWSNVPRLIGDLNTPAGDNSQFFSPTTGFPAIQVPMGFTRGGRLPAGMTFFGKAWDEPTLIKFAYAYEQATHHRHPPPSTPPLR